MTGTAEKKREALVAELKKKVESLYGQIEKHVKKAGEKADERLRMLRRQLKRKQRSMALLAKKGKPKKDEKAAGAP